jgi:hypothetical protein
MRRNSHVWLCNKDEIANLERIKWPAWGSQSLFRSVIMVTFQSVLTQKCIKIIFFYFLKIIFNTSALKWYKNIKKN